MLKKISIFIVCIFTVELISFLSGSGTHFEHYKYGLMLTVLGLNMFLVYGTKLLTPEKVRIRSRDF